MNNSNEKYFFEMVIGDVLPEIDKCFHDLLKDGLCRNKGEGHIYDISNEFYITHYADVLKKYLCKYIDGLVELYKTSSITKEDLLEIKEDEKELYNIALNIIRGNKNE